MDDDENDLDGDESESEKARRLARKKEKTEKESMRKKQKVGVIGHFLPSKAMMYSPEGDLLEPDKTVDKKPIQLVDLSVLKKGPHLTTEKTTKVRKGDFK